VKETMQVRYDTLSPEGRQRFDEHLAHAEAAYRERYEGGFADDTEVFIDSFENDRRSYEDERDGMRRKWY
jgi:hypothetical protein